jgi:TetR/AcrR family transcriptional regulator, mexJK operon transcriptional repressor
MPKTATAATEERVPAKERAGSKRRTILSAAQAIFLDRGYRGASMDEVAARAQASKVTVYKYFSDKHSLFIAVVTSAIAEAEEGTQSIVDHLGESDDIENDLRVFARQHIVDVTQPHLILMRRMIIAEASRFPELARAWHRRGPERAHATLARQIKQLADRGILKVTDPLLAAQHLNYLILSVPLNDAMFGGPDRRYTRSQLHRYADEGVRVFLAAYTPR